MQNTLVENKPLNICRFYPIFSEVQIPKRLYNLKKLVKSRRRPPLQKRRRFFRPIFR